MLESQNIFSAWRRHEFGAAGWNAFSLGTISVTTPTTSDVFKWLNKGQRIPAFPKPIEGKKWSMVFPEHRFRLDQSELGSAQ